MKLGNKFIVKIILIFISHNLLQADDKITSSPLLNIENIKPSFEEEDENENISTNYILKEKKNFSKLKSSQAVLIGLDKITAKTSQLIVNLNESKKFGPLERLES